MKKYFYDIFKGVHLLKTKDSEYIVDNKRLIGFVLICIELVVLIVELVLFSPKMLVAILTTSLVILVSIFVMIRHNIKCYESGDKYAFSKERLLKTDLLNSPDSLKKSVCHIFESEGFKINKNVDLSEYSADAVMTNKDDTIVFHVVQNFDTIDNNEMKEMIISMWNFGATKGYFVVDDTFDKYNNNISCSCNIEIWDKNTVLTRQRNLK